MMPLKKDIEASSGGKNSVDKRARARTNSICSSTTDKDKKEAFSNAIKKCDTPIKITFKNLSYTVRVKTTREERR